MYLYDFRETCYFAGHEFNILNTWKMKMTITELSGRKKIHSEIHQKVHFLLDRLKHFAFLINY